MRTIIPEFMRFSATDADALERDIADVRLKLETAVHAGNALAVVDAAADLGGMLTTARMEMQAIGLFKQHLLAAAGLSQHEPTAWFWNAYATALQYGGARDQAEPCFIKAIELARAGGWRRIEALALHHWGRSLAEQRRYADAVVRISAALAIRVKLNDPRQASSRRALIELANLQSRCGQPPDHRGSDAAPRSDGGTRDSPHLPAVTSPDNDSTPR